MRIKAPTSWTEYLLTACLFAAVLCASRAAAAQKEDPYDLIIVCNKAMKDPVDLSAVRDLFLRKRLAWPSGASAVPIHAPQGSKLRREFQRRVLEMTEQEERVYWEKAKIMHGLTAPPEFEGTLRAVFRLAGGIAYVFRAQFKEGVSRVLLTLPADDEARKGVPK